MVPKFKLWNPKAKKFHYDVENVYDCLKQQHVNDKTQPTRGFTLPFDHINTGLVWCQSIGLKDKSGKDIYEGDIIKVYGQFEIPYDDKKDFEVFEYEHLGTVSFDNGSFVFKNHLTRNELIEHKKAFPDSDTDIETYLTEFLRIEIIGNIYENPGLLP